MRLRASYAALLHLTLFALISATASLAAASAADENASSVEATRRSVPPGVHFGALPIFNYNSDRGLQSGVLAQRFDYGAEAVRPFESLTTVQLSYASRGSRDLILAWEKTGFTSEALRLVLEFDAFRNPYSRYYGLGDSSSYDVERQARGDYFFTQESLDLHAGVRKRVAPDLDGTVMITPTYLSSRSNGAGTVYEAEAGPGVRRNFYTRLSGGLVLERRDSEFSPSRGYYAAALLSGSPAFLADTGSWARLDLDFHRHFSLIDDRWLSLATQLRYAASTPEAPLLEKARLGGASTLRGLPLSRYLANHSLGFRAEVRALLIRTHVFSLPLKLGGGVFGDTGRVGDDLARLFQTETRFAWGVTLFGSYFTDDFIGTADLGFAREGSALYLRLGHAF